MVQIFKNKIVLLILAASLILTAGTITNVAGQKKTAAPGDIREVITLNKLGWKFIQDDSMTDDKALASSGRGWTTVTLPHTWNAKDAASTVKQKEHYKRGLGWYRLDFNFNGNGATQWLQFDGASIVADVWLNGTKLGSHAGAFTKFRFNVTGKLNKGKNNILVKCNNSEAKTGADPTAIAPLSGDFNMSGGLYRSVSIVTTKNLVHFVLDDFGSPGIFAKTTAINTGAKTATVNVLAKLKNDSAEAGTYTVSAMLIEANGKTKKSVEKNIEINAGTAETVSQDISVESVRQWNGVADPYLYSLAVELKNSKGAVIDKFVTGYGIRKMVFDVNKGFFLNDVYTPLHGVNMHQDYEGMAWAITEKETDKSLALIKEIGANTVRLAHYPHNDYILDQCDRIGLVVWAELPYVNQSILGTSPPFRPYSGDFKTNNTSSLPSFTANAKLQLQELIRQQYNHASIGMWSIANEAGYYAKTEYGIDTVTKLLKELNELAKAEDPTRVTTLADADESVKYHRNPFKTCGITDTVGLNRYFGWYYGPAGELGAHLDSMHATYPKQPIGVSEYGAGSALTHQTDNVLGGPACIMDISNKTRVNYQPEGFANYVHEESYKSMMARPYIWGTYVWTMFDFGSGERHEGDIENTNTKGLVTFDRNIKKDTFFFYKANWSKDKVVCITGRRYTNRAYKYADIKVYSNADSVSLKVNGARISSVKPDEFKTCVFENIQLKSGTNIIIAEGAFGKTVKSDTAEWNLDADNAVNVYIACGQLTTGFISSGHRFGSDNFFSCGTGIAMFTRSDKTIPKDSSGKPYQDGSVYDCVRLSTGSTSFSYRIPVANGKYEVTLGFLEPDKNIVAKARVFKVIAEGNDKLSDIDIIKEAGAYRTSVTPKKFTVEVTDGMLNLDFVPTSGGGAVVSNISVIKQ